MEGLMFSTPMRISSVNMDSHVSGVGDLIDNSAARKYFATQMEPILEPYEGMEFESEEGARVFYSTYATYVGFKVRVSSFVRSKRDKTIISRQLVCSREGFRSNTDSNNEGRTKRPRMITRVGCRCMIMAKKQSSGKWVITKCEKTHNHVLGSQGKVVMLDFDPYACVDDDVKEKSLDVVPHRDVLLDNTDNTSVEMDQMVVVPPEGDPCLEPQLGMEFESENAAQILYRAYGRRVGFRTRVSSYYRSKRDNSIISRLIVCSKEGFRAKKDDSVEEKLQRSRAITRVGCKAMVMVKKKDPGKWSISKLVKNHNHVLVTTATSADESFEDDDDDDGDKEMIEVEKAFSEGDGGIVSDPYEGMEFESEEAAKEFYFAYSKHVGFNMRVSTYYCSKRDKSVISRLLVCSKEGFYTKKGVGCEGSKIKRPREVTRVGCKAMFMVKRNNSGKWVVSRFVKEHNHELGVSGKMHRVRKRKRLTKGNVKLMKNQIELQNSSARESSSSCYNNICSEAIKCAEVGAASPDVYNVTPHALLEAMENNTCMNKNGANTEHGDEVDNDCRERDVNKEEEEEEDHADRMEMRSRVLKAQSTLICDEMPQNMRLFGGCNQAVADLNASHECLLN